MSDASRAWSVPALGTDDYASNGLNQYAQIESASIAHEGNGGVATDHRGRTYTYDAEGRLKWVREGTPAIGTYAYSSEGAIRYRTASGAATRHFHDGGGQELAQYDGATYALQYRFVRLPGSVDDAFLMLDYVSSGCGSGCAVYVHKDARGSTVSTSDASGAETAAYQYSPYGESGPEGDAGFPFRFTGQRLDASTGLYNYKARFYDPETGRFLSADPIGYADGMNMYAYVGGDPVNRTDPTGLYWVLDTVTAYGSRSSLWGYEAFESMARSWLERDLFGDWRESHGNGDLRDRKGNKEKIKNEDFGKKINQAANQLLCAYDKTRLNNYSTPDSVESNASSAISRTTFSQYSSGNAGLNVDRASRYIYTDSGWVDLQHVVSAAYNPVAPFGLSEAAGYAFELRSAIRFPRSAFADEDLRSNRIGSQAAQLQRLGGGSLSSSISSSIYQLGAYSRKTASIALITQGGCSSIR